MKYFDIAHNVINQVDESLIYQMYALLKTLNQQEGSLFCIGNGGSNSLAGHFATDVSSKYQSIRVFAITDSALITRIANDFGYENVFLRAICGIIKSGDMVVAFSSSGESENVIRAVEMAKNKDAVIVTFTGFKETNCLKKLGDINFWIDSDDYGIVESCHTLLFHKITQGI